MIQLGYFNRGPAAEAPQQFTVCGFSKLCMTYKHRDTLYASGSDRGSDGSKVSVEKDLDMLTTDRAGSSSRLTP
jgi:hypothetical protein